MVSTWALSFSNRTDGSCCVGRDGTTSRAESRRGYGRDRVSVCLLGARGDGGAVRMGLWFGFEENRMRDDVDYYLSGEIKIWIGVSDIIMVSTESAATILSCNDSR